MTNSRTRSKTVQLLDIAFILLGIGILALFTSIYLMPFRLDDVLHMDWAREHSFWDAFDVQKGEIVRSVRPVFAMTIWLLTHYAGVDNYFPWHFVLVSSFLVGLTYMGKTARYIANDPTALYYSVGFFWIAFLPILNMLFWYGDLTFTLELMFVAPAWYYGIRGLLEGRLVFWVIGIASGIFAVLSKEPAILLVHSVLVGVTILRYSEIREIWKLKTIVQKLFVVGLYIAFLAISIKLYLASPTKSNRFFDITAIRQDQLLFFIKDRLRYYGESLLNPIARLILATPLLYPMIKLGTKNMSGRLSVLLSLLISVLVAVFVIKSIFAFALLLILLGIFSLGRKKFGSQTRLLLPFIFCGLAIIAVLLITTMLVKTQLAELSFVLLVIVGVYWSNMIQDFIVHFKLHLLTKIVRVNLLILSVAIGGSMLYASFPALRAKEQLLTNVRDVRSNANDAIKWMGINLPHDCLLLVTGPRLYGFGSADDMTSKEDEYKLYAQYTFLQGYIRSYFRALGRSDISLQYLEDSLSLEQILVTSRERRNTFLFLQTGLDVDRFHQKLSGVRSISNSDSLLSRFTKGPYPSEIWKLRNNN